MQQLLRKLKQPRRKKCQRRNLASLKFGQASRSQAAVQERNEQLSGPAADERAVATGKKMLSWPDDFLPTPWKPLHTGPMTLTKPSGRKEQKAPTFRNTGSFQAISVPQRPTTWKIGFVASHSDFAVTRCTRKWFANGRQSLSYRHFVSLVYLSRRLDGRRTTCGVVGNTITRYRACQRHPVSYTREPSRRNIAFAPTKNRDWL